MCVEEGHWFGMLLLDLKQLNCKDWNFQSFVLLLLSCFYA